MSHELQTPLTVTMGIVDLALLETEEPGTRRYLDATRQSSESLLTLISDLLNLSGIEQGHLRGSISPRSRGYY